MTPATSSIAWSSLAVSAECEEPENRDTGTTFTCTAVDDNGGVWEFEAEIGDGDSYVLNVSRYP